METTILHLQVVIIRCVIREAGVAVGRGAGGLGRALAFIVMS